MPTVLLHGGLGNQLFQYAVGRALSVRTGTNLELETSRLSPSTPTTSTPRRLHLRAFRTRGEQIHRPIHRDRLLKARFKLFGLLRPISVALATRICRVHRDQDPQRFTPQVLEMPGPSFLYGYYQTEKYFADIRGTLREELSPRSALTDENRTWRDRIEATNAAAVHVRRGDYVEQGWSLPHAYYRSAIEALQSLHGPTDLFFFSDDMGWVRDHIDRLLPDRVSPSSVHYVDNNSGEEAPKDLLLMSHCRHNIIANSTLSWWGAWLNRHDKKTVLAPSYWIHAPVDDTDIIPERWHTVDWRSAAPTGLSSQNGPQLS